MFELDVPDMTCNHCAATIARAVKDIDGAVRCEIDVAAKRVRIDRYSARGVGLSFPHRRRRGHGLQQRERRGQCAAAAALASQGVISMPQAKYFELADAKRDGSFNIGQAARASGVSAKMIRHYEENGFIPKAGRTVAGYRIYHDADVHVLRFIRRSRDLGFSMKEIQALLGLWNNRRRASSDVKRLATRHVADLDAKIAELQAMRRTLLDLASHCHGDHRPDCPILDDLAAGN
jgi:MerR family transcriptional regulator, copper efflux regulator